MTLIKHLTSGNDRYENGTDGVSYDLVIDYGGNDRYFWDPEEPIPDLMEPVNGGLDIVILDWRMFGYTLPENVENLDGTLGGDDEGARKTFTGNDLDNRMDFKSSNGGSKAWQTVDALGGNDWVHLGVGNDTANLGAGDDEGFGGRGNDLIRGGTGEDYIKGGSGADTLFGDDHSDEILGGAGNDWMDGGQGRDTLMGEDGNDTLIGYWGNDILDGGSGNDDLNGGTRNDRLFGRAGRDTLEGGKGDDRLFGGANPDTFIFREGDFGRDVVLGYTAGFEDSFHFSKEYWGGAAPDLALFMQSYVSTINGDKNAVIDLGAVGGGEIVVIGARDAPFDTAALADDLYFF